MHRKKPSRVRLLVPSALAVAILSGAAAPAGAADGSTAELTERVAAVQQKIETIEDRAAAGPIDDLLAGLTKTLQDLLKSVGALLPAGVTLPPIELPKLPALPAVPGLPDLSLPDVTLPQVQLPAAPPAGGVPALPTDLVPALPDIPDVP
ncbi:hypothetical protein ACFWUW_12955 [Streptomyces sp. NPDC058655]|uniref:hypothetical protein n=1 Tax=Streptomyces sp. NPDC058655 TaxID=3346577 RepID=UPI0036615910